LFAERPTQQQLDQAAAFVRSVIFKRWSPKGEGPDSFSCWGLARVTQRELAGIDLPLVDTDPDDVRAVVRAIEESPLRADWLAVDSPRHTDLVTMSHSRRGHHIGTYLDLDGGGILHVAKQFDRKGEWAPQKPAVCFTALPVLPMEGWARVVFLRHRGPLDAS
jgi:cell wall-associated NlpC family hydrolase